MKKTIKRLAHPLRLALGRWVIPPERLLPVSPQNTMTLMEKVAAYVASEKLQGDYLEFGVFQGWGLGRSYHALRVAFEQRSVVNPFNCSPEDSRERLAIWDAMRFFAFDSFEGLPETRGIDADSADFRGGQYAVGMDTVRDNLKSWDVPLDKVVCVPGWFNKTCNPETLAKHKLTKAAVVFVDGDLYESARDVLGCLNPILQDGTVIIFDDWFNFRGNPGRGEQRAFAEWKQTVEGYTFAEYNREGPYRISFIASRVMAD